MNDKAKDHVYESEKIVASALQSNHPASLNDHVHEEPTRDATREVVEEQHPQYMKGWRLYMLTLGIWLALLLSTLETTIVSTCLVEISDALSGFELRNWIVTSYFLTYTGFLIIYAKLSSIFGNKTMILLAVILFTVFSVGCGVAHSITTLIILRAFQGMGASGIYSMVLVIAPTLVPKTEYGKLIGVISSVYALGSVLGPILGGVIATNTTWRWVFLLNAPAGALSIVLIAVFLPSKTHDPPIKMAARLRAKFVRSNLQRVDLLGAFLILVASVLLVFALEEGGSRYRWDSAAIIASLVISTIAWISFIAWEVWLEKSHSIPEPIFPMRLLKNRVLAGMMAVTFLVGFPFVAIVVNIPQRAQAVDGYSPVKAGLALLALLLSSPFATVISGVLASSFKVPPIYMILTGAVLQTVGVGLTINLPSIGGTFAKEQYAYEVIMGLGFGLILATVLTLANLICEEKDAGLMMSALTQVRVMGGTISLAICSAILRNHLVSRLATIISPKEFQDISENLSSIQQLSAIRIEAVRSAFAVGFNKQMQVLTGFSGAALLASLFLWERDPRVVR